MDNIGNINNIGKINNIAFLIGRVIVGCFFLMNGLNHFAQLNMLAGYAKSNAFLLPLSQWAVRAWFSC